MNVSRRMRASLLGLAILAVPSLRAKAVEITHGPILGRPSAVGMGVWARTDRPGAFHVEYQVVPNGPMQRSNEVTTELARDNTGVVYLTGLVPQTHYAYRVVADGQTTGPGGSFRTWPSADEHRNVETNPEGLFNFSFEFGCGNNQGRGGGGTELAGFKTMREQQADRIQFAILNGDWLYEQSRDTSPDAWRQQVGIGEPDTPRAVRLAPGICGVWENYKTYLTNGANLAAWHANVPSFFTFDDHEILNDVNGAGSPGMRDRRTVFRDVGVEAWYHYLGWSDPVGFTQGIRFGNAEVKTDGAVLTDNEFDFTTLDFDQAANLHIHWGGPSAGVRNDALNTRGGDPNAMVYEIVEVLDAHRLRLHPAPPQDGAVTYSIGRRSYFRMPVSNSEFFFLDTRSHRGLHDTSRPDLPGLSMLGIRQRDWLMESMKSSDADFLFVVSTVNFMIPHISPANPDKDEAWTVFLEERERLIDFWDGLGKKVFVLTGDLHNSFAIKITDNVWEFASSPHNSANHTLDQEGDRPPNGPFQYGPRPCEIRWSTAVLPGSRRPESLQPIYCVVQVNNVFDNPTTPGGHRWVTYPRPQVIFNYFDGRSGSLRYAEAVLK